MTVRSLLDTSIVVRYLQEPRKLSREPIRILDEAVRRNEQVAMSAITLLEIAHLFSEASTRFNASLEDLFAGHDRDRD